MSFNDEVALLVETVRIALVSNANDMAATCLLAYDILITSGQEVKVIWRSPWSLIALLYIAIRYYSMTYLLMSTFVDTNTVLPKKFCDHYVQFQLWGGVILVPVVDILIVTRIYALYNRDKRMGAFLAVIWVAELICSFVFVGLGFKATGGTMENPLPGLLSGCFTANPADFQQVLRSGGVSAAFQAVYLAATMFKMYQFVQTFGFSMTPLLQVFFRDGAGYCVMLLAVFLLNTFLERFGPDGLQGAGESWLMAIVSITACRMVLNMKHFAAPVEVRGSSTSGMLTELHIMGFPTDEAPSNSIATTILPR